MLSYADLPTRRGSQKLMPHVFILCWSQAEHVKISDIP